MARFSLTGVIQNIGPTQSFGSNGFTKRDIVISEEGTKYPNPVKFTLKKDNCALADNFHEGDKVTITVSISGREWENKAKGTTQYFVDLDAYKIEEGDGQGQVKDGGKKGKGVPPPAYPTVEDIDMAADIDNMPF